MLRSISPKASALLPTPPLRASWRRDFQLRNQKEYPPNELLGRGSGFESRCRMVAICGVVSHPLLGAYHASERPRDRTPKPTRRRRARQPHLSSPASFTRRTAVRLVPRSGGSKSRELQAATHASQCSQVAPMLWAKQQGYRPLAKGRNAEGIPPVRPNTGLVALLLKIPSALCGEQVGLPTLLARLSERLTVTHCHFGTTE